MAEMGESQWQVLTYALWQVLKNELLIPFSLRNAEFRYHFGGNEDQ